MVQRELVARYFEAVNSENWDLLETVFHPEAVFQTPGAAPRHGVDEILILFRRLFDAWQSHLDAPVRQIHEGDVAAVEIRFTGISTAGKRISFEAVDLFTFAGDQVSAIRSFYDLGAVRQALAAEEPGSAE